MYQLQGTSQIMTHDEAVLVRREDDSLGDNVIVLDGKRVKRGFIEFAVRGNVQPVSGTDLIMEGPGDRFNDQMWLYAADRERPLQPNDLVFRVDDGWYQVQECAGWGGYSRSRMQRIEVGRYSAQPGNPDITPQPNLELLSQI